MSRSRAELWRVSDLNHLDEVRSSLNLPKRVIINDMTCREGEQGAGVGFRKDEKILMARKLDEAGIPQIQVGSRDQSVIKEIVKLGLSAKIEVLTMGAQTYGERAPRDWRKTADNIIDLDVDILDFLFYASDNLGKLREDEVVGGVTDCVEYAKDRGVIVSIDPMDTPRGDLDLVLRIYRAAWEAGADRIRVLDTVGTCSPAAWRYLLRKVGEAVPKAPIGVHCHNDFGHGMANLFVALEEGAEILDCTTNGLGERAGNPDTTVVATALTVLYGLDTGVRLERLYELSKLVEDLSKSPISWRNPLTGEAVFRHSAHDVNRTRFPWAWDAVSPELVGRKEQLPLLGKLTGPITVKTWLKELGIRVPESQIPKIRVRINEEAEMRKRVLVREDLERIVRETSLIK